VPPINSPLATRIIRRISFTASLDSLKIMRLMAETLLQSPISVPEVLSRSQAYSWKNVSNTGLQVMVR
jgi:hypothetical protein